MQPLSAQTAADRNGHSLQRNCSEIDQQCKLLLDPARQKSLCQDEKAELTQVLKQVCDLRNTLRRTLRKALSNIEDWDGIELIKVVPSIKEQITGLPESSQLALARIVQPSLLSQEQLHRNATRKLSERDHFHWKVSAALAEVLTTSSKPSALSSEEAISLTSLATIAEILSDQVAFSSFAKDLEEIRKSALRISQRLERLIRATNDPLALNQEFLVATKSGGPTSAVPLRAKRSLASSVPLVVKQQLLVGVPRADENQLSSERKVESLEEAAKKIGVEIHILEENLLSRHEQTSAFIRLRRTLQSELQDIMREIEEARDRMRLGSVTSPSAAQAISIFAPRFKESDQQSENANPALNFNSQISFEE